MSQAGSLGEDGLLVGCGGWFNGTDRVGGWVVRASSGLGQSGWLHGWVKLTE